MAHATRVADMRRLNRQRWDAHVRARDRAESGGGAYASVRRSLDERAAPTGGALFNRPNPRDAEGNYTNPYVRADGVFVAKRGELVYVGPRGNHVTVSEDDRKRLADGGWQDEKQNQDHLVPVYGADVTSVNPASHRKYRIPPESVVNKVGDCKLFLCCFWRLTAVRTPTARAQRACSRANAAPAGAMDLVAQFFLLPRPHDDGLPHALLRLLALDSARWPSAQHVDRHRARHGPHPPHHAGADAADDRQQRVRMEPGLEPDQPARRRRQRVLPAGQRHAGAKRTAHPRARPAASRRRPPPQINFATLTLSFFAISAVFHFWACIVGLFERFWFIYWRQMDGV